MKKLILGILLLPLICLGALTNQDRQEIQIRNLAINGGFENGKATVVVSAVTPTIITSDVGEGKSSLSWNPTATGQTLRWGTVQNIGFTRNVLGQNCLASFMYSGFDNLVKFQVLDESNVVLNEETLSATTLGTVWRRVNLSFVCPTGTSMRIKLGLATTGNAALGYIDSGYIGNNYLLGMSSQAQFIGSAAIYAASCVWSESGTTLVEPAADTDCTGPQIESNPGPGTIQTTDTDLPRFTVNNLPAGNYKVVMTFTANAGTANAGFAINDGTTSSGHSGGDGTTNKSTTLVGNFVYTAAGDRTFKLFINSTGDTTVITASDLSAAWRLRFSIYRYPGAAEQTYTADKLANSWTGYHTATNCAGMSTTSATLAEFSSDSDCDLVETTNTNFGTVTSYESAGSELPGITFTPSRAGKYEVCATGMAFTTSTAVVEFRLTDGTTSIKEIEGQNPTNTEAYELCGQYQVSTLTAKTVKILGATSAGTLSFANSGGITRSVIEWRIKQIDQGFPMPLIVNSVVTPSSGVEGIARALVSNAGVVSSESGDWINGNCSVSGGASNVYTCTLNAGFFSAAPVCTATVTPGTGIGQVAISTLTSSSIVAETSSVAGVASDRDFSLICIGPK